MQHDGNTLLPQSCCSIITILLQCYYNTNALVQYYYNSNTTWRIQYYYTTQNDLVWGPQMINVYHRPYKWRLSSMTPTRKHFLDYESHKSGICKKTILPQLQHYYNTTTDLPQHYDNTTTVVLNNSNTLLLQWDYSSTTTRLLQYHDTTDEESFWWGPHKESLVWTPLRRIIDCGSHT
jgi:hypothetical protein